MDTILLVNDSPTLTKVLTNHFQKAGYKVLAVTGAMDAYETFIRNELQLILTDYLLKDKDGKQLMKPTEGVSDADAKALVAYMRKFKK